MAKTKILWCSQSISLDTGYGTVSREILMGLHNTGEFEVMHQAWEEPLARRPSYSYESQEAVRFPFKMFGVGAVPGDPEDMRHGQKNFQALHDIYQPDITVILTDLFMVKWLLNMPHPPKTRLVLYFPVDGSPIPPEWVGVMRKADRLVTYSKFGETITNQMFKSGCDMIYHGVDYKFWSQPLPRPAIDNKKIQMFGDKDVFIWGMVARNNPRKNIPAFYEAFSAHSKNNPKSRLVMHCANIDYGWNMTQLAYEFKIKDKVWLTPNLNPAVGVPREELRLLYNTMDIHVNTATGEGFGIPIMESMAAGIPNLMTAYTTAHELIHSNDAGELIKVANFISEPITHIRRAYVDVSHLLSIMNRLCYDRPTLNRYGRNAKTAASRFDWSQIIPQWVGYLKKVIEEKKAFPVNMEIL